MAHLIQHHITLQALGASRLFAAVEAPDGRADLFFTRHSRVSPAVAAHLLDAAEHRTLGEAPWISGKVRPDGLSAYFEGEKVEIALTPRQPDIFANRNVALSTRNGESAETVLEWLSFHVKHQGLTGALILNRAKPWTDEDFVARLEAGLSEFSDLTVMLVDFDAPLGAPDMPSEHHPYCTPGAPGKDRMDVPDADPWCSPLSEVILYEMMHRLFLSEARAVANIEVYDLIPLHPKLGSIFDLAQTARGGVVQLLGQQCYPWRIREEGRPRFADHICVQFDEKNRRGRWCAAPKLLADHAVFRLVRIGGAAPRVQYPFYRFMGLRHLAPSVSKLVPKSSLIEHQPLIDLSESEWAYDPIHMPTETVAKAPRGDNSVAIVTCMKNEGPFILEWLAYHRAIGIEGFLVYTNDCTDGTDTFLELLQAKGYVQHRDNKFHDTGLKPQHHALKQAEKEPVITESDWAISMDVDEFINIKVGDGTMRALFEAVPDANLISCTWRLFGNNDVHDYQDRLLIEQFDRCAPEFANKPHQAWGFKTLFKNVGLFKKLGVHRPKGLKPQIWDKIRWYNGSAKPMPETEFRNAWRSNSSTYGYDVVQLNHYAVRSSESFLVKRDRGRVNHVDRDQGLAYWFRMNNNAEEERSIQRMLPKLQEEYDRLLSDPEIRAMHEACVAAHRAKIEELKQGDNYAKFFAELTGPRMEKLSRLHRHFGANVFLSGPESVPDDIIARDPDEDFFFTVERGEIVH
ncbi:glycosyltransferase family 2 protein [Celeribacter litoreus]|uniref:glycosyltransferase family 2 protein n=1 Tax=Celeribacter litoreus TaxID=2876714 RepID=UPI001CCF7044|nr:glycosyltransferase family 2 protein [Celeribacter litoreus]MCA0044523.1 glycosyltransferase family 2 protein [Celeribacter litoreus]